MTEQLVTELQQTHHETVQYFSLSPSELEKCYGEGKWNVRQILHHLADTETVLYERIRRVIAKPNQVIQSYDQDAWANALNYREAPLALNLQIYSSVRSAVIDLAERFYSLLGSNTWIHSETGPRTLKDEFDKVAWHNRHHLQQIKQALDRA